MMLSTTLLAQTVKLAQEQFFKTTQESEAQLLCASLSTYIESELEGAEPYSEDDGTDAGASGTNTNTGSIQSALGPRFNSSTHNMGSGAYFYVLADSESTSGEAGVSATASDTGSGSVKGQVVETSPYYQSFGTKDGNGGLGYYNIAGNGAYEVGKNHRYDLCASMDYSYSNGSYTVNIVVYRKNLDKAVLAENSFSVSSK